MESLKWVVAVGLLALGGATAPAQEHHLMHAMPAAKVEVRSSDGRVTVPFRLSGNHIVIPISIQGTRLDAILDTGMPMDGVMLYRNGKVGRLTLAAQEGMQARVGGAGSETDTVAADIVPGLTIDVGNLRLTDAIATVMPPVPGFVGDHDGVIGASLFRNFAVAIDFDAGRITLQDPKRWAPPAGATVVPIAIERNMPFAQVVVLTREGRRIPTKVVVDLGAAHPISLNIGATEGIEAPAGAIQANIGRGISGVLRGQVGRIAGLEVGDVALHDVVATFPEREHQRPGGMNSVGGNLGTGLLQHFNVTFDYAHRKLYLAPNKSFDRPFEWDMSGLWLEPDGKDVLRVSAIVANSPAASAGFEVGDVLEKVDGRDVTQTDLPTLTQQFRQEGGVFAITLTRDGRQVEATLRLKRLV
jgi:PDZ domain-containing protein